MSEDELKYYEDTACPTCGSCSGMFTANSMNCLCEALGIALPGNGTIPAVYSERLRLAKHAGMKVMELLERGISFRDLVSAAAIHNACLLYTSLVGAAPSEDALLHCGGRVVSDLG